MENHGTTVSKLPAHVGSYFVIQYQFAATYSRQVAYNLHLGQFFFAPPGNGTG
jgi:hypothetical protein